MNIQLKDVENVLENESWRFISQISLLIMIQMNYKEW